MNPLLLTDFYKVHHNKMYPEGTTLIYSNFTPRKSRIDGVDHVVFFGLQHFILEYLINRFKEDFFYVPWDELEEIYKKHIPLEDISHIKRLHELRYLPIEIKALPEGTLVPIKVPCFTIYNTHPDFGWLTNYLETLISCSMWQPITSATIAYEYKKLLTKYALETTGSSDFVQWQGHDFSMRGLSSVESAILSGMGHLVSFTGTDTIPAIYALESSYDGSGLIGASVPATEHSVMCMGTKEDEVETFKRLLDLYPTGILSVVSDTWDLWKVLTEILPKIKDQVMAREGKLVIRPDSGDPVDILCGESIIDSDDWINRRHPKFKGVIESLWDLFGGKVNEYGYKELDGHIGAIYGDSITLERARQICERLKTKGFASTNVVLGIGSYTYQYNTRDTFGFAMKATYGELSLCEPHMCPAKDVGCGRPECRGKNTTFAREIFKDPVTDDGTKKSAKGLLAIHKRESGLYLKDQCNWFEESQGMLETVFKDGKLVKRTTLSEIRQRLAA